MATSDVGKVSKQCQTSAMSMMGDISDFFENQMQALYTLSDSMIAMNSSKEYVSMIKMNGKSIPPPLMTEDKIEEMRKYKKLAMELEAKLHEERKKRLVSKVQAIVDSIEERITPIPPPSETVTPECSPVLPEESFTSLAVDSVLGSSYNDTSREQAASTPIESPESKVNDDVSGKDSGLGDQILHLDATDDMIYRSASTGSSSDISELNRTVIAVNDSCDSISSSAGSTNTVTEREDSTTKVLPSVQDINVDQLSQEDISEQVEYVDPELKSQPNVLEDANQMDAPATEDLQHDVPPPSDSESLLSLLGDYNPLPTPTPTTLDDAPIEPHSKAFPVPAESLSPQPAAEHTEKSTAKTIDAVKHYEDRDLLSTGSTDQLTFGSAAQSCSLPVSYITESTDTLRDIHESVIDESTEVYDSRRVRGAPVGQEVSGDVPLVASSSSREEESPPECRRRRGSYTLDEPSPALVKAQSDQDVSVESLRNLSARRSLEFSGEENLKTPHSAERTEAKKPLRKGKSYHASIEKPAKISQEHYVVLRSPPSSHSTPAPAGQLGIAPTFSRPLTRCDPVTEPSESVMGVPSQPVLRPATTGYPVLNQEELLLQFQQQQMEYFEQLRTQLFEQQKQQLEQLLLQQNEEQVVLQMELEEQERKYQEEQRKVIEQVTIQHEKTENQDWLEKVKVLRHLEGRDDSDVESRHSSQSTPCDSLEDIGGSTTSGRPHTSESLHRRQPYYFDVADTSTASIISSPQLNMSNSPRMVALMRKATSRDMKHKYDLMSATVKGYLTRRLLKTEKVQEIVKTLTDTYRFVYSFQEETPVKRGNLSPQDVRLAERVIAQLRAALLDMHEIFFEISTQERMAIIYFDRLLKEERRLKKQKPELNKKVSAATKKVMERRKQIQTGNTSTKAVTSRPKTAPPPVTSTAMKKTTFDARVLKPIQGVESPRRPNDNQYRASKYSSNKEGKRPKTAPLERTRSNPVVQPVASKKSSVTVTQKGARRSLYPLSTVSSKARPKSPRGKTTKRKV
uniref:Uncharacterized protein LOC100373865 n=1 Tax=Saccoglossus kowalevskii TaxID=10224 RepID=A0ABM0GRG2_SACKO|nr:PREDICTED: uncharacterized protein LOC100373865 [Saccoglossus kowalevskii]